MHWSDLLIIYFSCGAPFGVYFFLHNRGKMPFFKLLFSSIGAAAVWIAYAYLLRREKITKRFTKKDFFSESPEISLLEQQTSMMQEQILQEFILLNSKAALKLQFFAFRDVLERFVGLTIAVKKSETGAGENEHEIFKVSGRKGKDAALAGKCLSRRNRSRLSEHQKSAREDFLKVLANLPAGGVPVSGRLNGDAKVGNFSLLKDLILELLELIDVKLIVRAEDIFKKTETLPVSETLVPETNKEAGSLSQAA
jgi:hypothetical protein